MRIGDLYYLKAVGHVGASHVLVLTKYKNSSRVMCRVFTSGEPPANVLIGRKTFEHYGAQLVGKKVRMRGDNDTIRD